MKQILLALLASACTTGCTLPLSTTAYNQHEGYHAINATYTAGRTGAVLRKYPKVFTPILKNVRVGDTLYVHGRINHDWYVVRRSGKKYFAPYRDIYAFSIADIVARPQLDSFAVQLTPIPLLAE
ncbi:SH3 domain-containing protein [Adhaeribacter pallidiroseus]|uniref:SH3b domain-containing protein n=1 Tax=Adhaeribacter pallidiroseus TaxID=2072847 RepID=A0A369QER6_9BACT|nr:hypothetical protein [Adhaeribacter pallidiroseus]RDC63413.1 hypothetical protein AHMF7616_02016 [Adhaeribacter pallidiroseus]